jgi:antitoxin HicB
MQTDYIYPARIEADEDGAFVVSFPDVPEALTGDADRKTAEAEAVDCLLAALGAYIKAREPIPFPSPLAANDLAVELPALATAKLALYAAARDRGWSNVRLGQELGLSESQVRRLLDLRHASSIDAIADHLRKLGRRLVITTQAA